MRRSLRNGRGCDARRGDHRPSSLALPARSATTGTGSTKRNRSGDDGSFARDGEPGLHFTPYCAGPGASGDDSRSVLLQQVLMNLMINGIEAMGDTGGELTVTSKRSDDGQLLISVTDSGTGLPDDIERIFEAFFTTKPQGTGMGLSISRRIVESHGGRLWASRNTGGGATFQFVLPPA